MRRLAASLWITAYLVAVAATPSQSAATAAQPEALPAADVPSEPPAQAAAPSAATQPPVPSAANAQQVPTAGRKPGSVKEWLQANPHTVRNTVLGALGGAVLGGLAARARGGSVVKGALAGGMVGGLAGYVVGRQRDKLFGAREEAMRRAAYDPAQGYVLRLDAVNAEPASITPGGTSTLSVRYLVIGPDPSERITVHCFRGLKLADTYLTGDGPRTFVVQNGGGIVESTSEITVPKEAPAGSYEVETLIEDPRGRFHQTAATPLYIATGHS